MITPLLHITMPEDDGEDRHFAPIILALQAMISVNKWHIQRGLERARRGKGLPVPPLYASGVRYKEDPPGQENWKDCLQVLADGHGDCLPVSSLVLRANGKYHGEIIPLVSVQAGDELWGDGEWTRVSDARITGGKRVIEFQLDNGCTQLMSREHRVFVMDGDKPYEVPAAEVTQGMALASPLAINTDVADAPGAGDPHQLIHAVANLRREKRGSHPRIERITDAGHDLCMDITTSSGKFWLPESDLLVHNCDRLVSWRVAELEVRGIPCEPVIKWQQVPKQVMVSMGHPAHMVPEEGISMVHVLVRFPNPFCPVHSPDPRRRNPNAECACPTEDPSKILGMGGSFTSQI